MNLPERRPLALPFPSCVPFRAKFNGVYSTASRVRTGYPAWPVGLIISAVQSKPIAIMQAITPATPAVSAAASPLAATFVNIAAYKFITLDDTEAMRPLYQEQCLALELKGTILLTPEGINMFLSGTARAYRRVPGLGAQRRAPGRSGSGRKACRTSSRTSACWSRSRKKSSPCACR